MKTTLLITIVDKNRIDKELQERIGLVITKALLLEIGFHFSQLTFKWNPTPSPSVKEGK